MKLTIDVTSKQEVDIKLPYFFKNGGTYAILSENRAISIYETISVFKFAGSISNRIDGNHTEITAEEFTKEYDHAIWYLQSLKNIFYTK